MEKSSPISVIHGIFFKDNGDIFIISNIETSEWTIKFLNKYASFTLEKEIDDTTVLDWCKGGKRRPDMSSYSIYKLDRISDEPTGTITHYPEHPLFADGLLEGQSSKGEIL